MLSDAYNLVSRAGAGAMGLFQRMFDAIPGFAAALVLMFFISLVISLIIMPLRGKGIITAGGSDTVEPKRGFTANDWGSDVDHESAGK